jgi:hypothetical protein
MIPYMKGSAAMAYTEETLRKVLDRMQKDGEVDCYGNYDTDDSVCADCDLKPICMKDTATTFVAATSENEDTKNSKEAKKMAENEVTREDFEEMDEEELLETCEELEVEPAYKGKGKNKKLDKDATIDLLVEAVAALDDEDIEGDDSDDTDESDDDTEDTEDEGSEEDEEGSEDEESDDEESDDEDEELTREDLEEMEDDDLVEIAEELELEIPYTGKGKKKKLDREALIEAVLSLEDGEDESDDEDDSDDADNEDDSEDEPEPPKKDKNAGKKDKSKDKEPAKDKPKRAPRNTDGPSIESLIVEELKVGGTVNEITERVEPKLKANKLECKDVKMRVRRSTHYAAQIEGFYMHKDDTRGRGNTYYQLLENGKKPTAPKSDKKKK